MRRELFDRGVISQQKFESEVYSRAVESQLRERVNDPLIEEPIDIWETRLVRVRSYLTDLYFANNLPFELFEQIIREVLAERGAETDEQLVYFNPELAAQNILFEQAKAIEDLSPEARQQAQARLKEIKVVLIRRMISDQLAYINIAKEWFTIQDLQEIERCRIGYGKIGGKAAGMLLAQRILYEVAGEEIKTYLTIPDSYFLGADEMYSFMATNNLMQWNDQKYKSEQQIREEYPQICDEYLKACFPVETLTQLRELLQSVGKQPLIVRSSSLLEDNFGTSFAGKYSSIFCPNQGNSQENLTAFCQAIAQVYASVFNPDALLYRRQKGLQDYDERMAILIQVLQGEVFGKYYLPQASGVAFSRNTYRWSPQIRREDGFVRLVWGFGTRSVDRVGNDYPRLVALSHPQLHPEASSSAIQRYSQQFVDLIDLEQNAFITLPVREVLSPRYPILRYIAQIYQDGYLLPIRSAFLDKNSGEYVLTFGDLLQRSPMAERLRKILCILEENYHSPVDTEFTFEISDDSQIHPDVKITLLQCRPQSFITEGEVHLEANIPVDDIIFSTKRMVPRGRVGQIEYVIFVSPEGYFALDSTQARIEVGRVINRLNAKLAGKVFVCVGPGRWGTSNPDLGVFVEYSDLYNTRALIEVAGQEIGFQTEPSYGTHFFQDLVESDIYPLAIYLDDPDVIFNRAFFYDSKNLLAEILPGDIHLSGCLRVIEVQSFRPGSYLDLVMDDEQNRAIAHLVPKEER